MQTSRPLCFGMFRSTSTTSASGRVAERHRASRVRRRLDVNLRERRLEAPLQRMADMRLVVDGEHRHALREAIAVIADVLELPEHRLGARGARVRLLREQLEDEAGELARDVGTELAQVRDRRADVARERASERFADVRRRVREELEREDAERVEVDERPLSPLDGPREGPRGRRTRRSRPPRCRARRGPRARRARSRRARRARRRRRRSPASGRAGRRRQHARPRARR